MHRAAGLLIAVGVAAAAVVAVAAVRGGDDGFGASLRVVVRPDGEDGPVRRSVVRCDSPRDSRTCGRLHRTPLEAFAPTPPDAVCTEIYGGPATATVNGTIDGDPVRASFDRRDGCAIARWDRFGWLLGDPGAAAP